MSIRLNRQLAESLVKNNCKYLRLATHKYVWLQDKTLPAGKSFTVEVGTKTYVLHVFAGNPRCGLLERIH